MGRMGEFEDYNRECEQRRIESSSSYKYLEQENKQLKEMLKRCVPYNILAYLDLEANCIFCKGELKEIEKFGQFELNLKHDEDCEFIKLIR